MDLGQLAFVLAFVGAGAGVAWLGCVMGLKSRQLVSGGRRTTGRVVDLQGDSSSDGGTVYYPIVEFSDARGSKLRVKGSVGSAPAAFKLKEQVPVYYDPAHPEGAQIGTFGQLWLFPCILIGMGVVFITIGLATAVFG
jgi:hypothetical protein